MLRVTPAALAAALAASAGGAAHAIPRFAVRTGATCAACHVNPSGGGMRNRYGRNVFVPTRLAASRAAGGAGAWLADADLTDGVALGTDARFAALYTRPRAPQTQSFSFFLMQADAYLAASPAEPLTFLFDLGFYGASEAIVLLRSRSGLYLKAGRFMPSYGLRLESHAVFIREGIGFGPRQKDTGAELGWQRGPLHVQAAVLNGASKPDALLDENWQKALVGRVEIIRRGETLNLMAGASGYYNVSGVETPSTDTRAGEVRAGAFVGASLGRLAYLGEADFVEQRKFSEYKWARRYVSYQELNLLVFRGLELHLNWEYQDPDLRHSQNRFQRGMLGFEVFPVPGIEIKAFYRRVFGPDANPLSGSHEAFAMLHFFL